MSEPITVFPDRVLTVKQLARRVDRDPTLLRYWRLNGLGPKFFKLGNEHLYRLEDVEAWEAEQAARGRK